MTIYCACNFFNELDMLELRFETLNSLVDKFIVVESIKTHSNQAKPLYLKENIMRYSKFHEKLIHVAIGDSPNTYEDLKKIRPIDGIHQKIIDNCLKADWLHPVNDIAFIRDNYEKECMQLGLFEAKPDDIIIFGDVDEIPRPEALEKVLNNFNPNENYLFKQGSYHFYFNLEKTNEEWVGINLMSVGRLFSDSVGNIKAHQNVLGKRVENGGWHFSYMGGEEQVIRKLEAFSHQEFNTSSIKDRVGFVIEKCRELNIDIIGRHSEWALRDINDGTFPDYLVANQEKFEKYILKEKNE